MCRKKVKVEVKTAVIEIAESESKPIKAIEVVAEELETVQK